MSVKLAIFDIDQTILDMIQTTKNVYGKKVTSVPVYSIRTYLAPPNKISYYPKMVDILRQLVESQHRIIFITARPKAINYFTCKTLKYILQVNRINIRIEILNGRDKAERFGSLYRNAEVYFEDEPITFQKLFRINPRGYLVRQPYNTHLCYKYPCINPLSTVNWI